MWEDSLEEMAHVSAIVTEEMYIRLVVAEHPGVLMTQKQKLMWFCIPFHPEGLRNRVKEYPCPSSRRRKNAMSFSPFNFSVS